MRTVRSIVAGLFAMLIGSTALAAACDGFTDVDAAASYCTAVVYLKDHGITLGCTGTTYCPGDFVTRAQMALFLQRMGRADPSNTLGDHTTTIGGGTANTSNAALGSSTVGGGLHNAASGDISTVSGGAFNTASGNSSTVSGGSSNTASADYASVNGGSSSSASASFATVVGGGSNTASGNASTVVGGVFNEASGSNSFAAGTAAVAAEDGMFVWADSRGFTFDPTTFRAAGQSKDTFNVRATGVGGVFFVTGINASTGAPTWGCYAQNGGGWTCTSDRNVKRNIEPVDGQHVLDQLAAMPIYHWQPKDGPNMADRHVGPMAQDFYATFGLGNNDKAIGMQDAEGIALAAIQGLNAKLEASQALIADQARELIEIKAQLAAMAAH